MSDQPTISPTTAASCAGLTAKAEEGEGEDTVHHLEDNGEGEEQRPTKRRRQQSRKRLYSLQYGENIYYGACLRRLVEHINELVPAANLHESTILASISHPNIKRQVYKGVIPLRFHPATEDDWTRVASQPKAFHVQ